MMIFIDFMMILWWLNDVGMGQNPLNLPYVEE